jgi:hypothetical protein
MKPPRRSGRRRRPGGPPRDGGGLGSGRSGGGGGGRDRASIGCEWWGPILGFLIILLILFVVPIVEILITHQD